MIRMLLVASVLALGSASGATAQRTPSPSPLGVVVVVPAAYPAFEARSSVPLRAIVILKHPAYGDSSVVILNPAHADSRTLYEALSVVRRARTGGAAPAGPRSVALGLTPGVRPPPAAVAQRLETVLAGLRRTGTVPFNSHRTKARGARVADVRAFFP